MTARNHKAAALPRWKKAIRLGWQVLATLIVLAAIPLLWLGSGWGRDWVAATLSTALDGPGRDVEVDAIEGHPLGRFSLVDVRIADGRGLWLRSPKLTVSWHPLSLLFGEISVDEVASDLVQLIRLPVPAEGASGGGVPALPVFRVDHISANFRYGEDETDPYSLKADGLVYVPGELRADVDIGNQSGSDRMQATLRWQHALDALDLDLSLMAASDGLLANLLGVSGLGETSATLEGQGPLNGWDGTFAANIGTVLDAKGTLKGVEDGLGLSAEVHHSLDLAPALAGLMGDRVTLDGKLVRKGGQATRLYLIAGSGDTRLGVQADAGTDGLLRSPALKVALEARSYQLTLGGGDLALANVKVDGTASLHWPELDMNYEFQADGAEYPNFALHEITFNGKLTRDAYQIGGTLLNVRATPFDLPAGIKALAGPASVARASWNIRLNDGAWRIEVADAAMAAATIARLEAIGHDGELASLSLDAAAGAKVLEVVMPGLVHEGSVHLRAGITSEEPHDTLGGELVAEGRGLAFQNDTLAALAGPAPVARVTFKRSGAAPYEVEVATLEGAGVKARASGTLDAAQSALDLNVHASLADASVFLGDAVTVSDALSLDGRINGNWAQPALAASTTLASVSGYGMTLAGPRLEAALMRQADGWRGTLAFTGQSGLGPISANADLALADGFALRNISLQSPVALGGGAFARTPDGKLSLMLDIDLRNAETEAYRFSGQGRAEVRLAGQSGSWEGGISLALADVSYVPAGKFPLSLDRADGGVKFGDDGTLGANLMMAGLRRGAQTIDHFTLSSADVGTRKLDIRADGYMANAFDLKGSLAFEDGGASLDLMLVYGGVSLRTPESIAFSWADGLALDAPSVRVGDGILAAAARLKGAEMSGNLNGRAIPLAVINAVKPGLFRTGQADIELNAARGTGGDSGDLTLRLSDVRLYTDTLVDEDIAYAMALDIKADGNRLSLSTDAMLAGASLGHAEGAASYRRVETGGYEIIPDVPLDFKMTWDGEIGPLWVLARQPDHFVEGRLTGSLTLAGDIGTPVFAGTLSMAGGRYEYAPLGLVAENLGFTIDGNNDRVELKGLAARDGNGGTMTGSGSFAVTPTLAFPGEMKVKLTDFQAARLDSIRGTGSAEVTYVRAGGTTRLEGSIETGTTHINLPKELPTTVVDIDVTEIGNGHGFTPAADFSLQGKRRATDLRLDFSVPGRLFVRGRGLDSEWRGQLALRGTTVSPTITGSMHLTQGIFMLGGKRFELEQGTLTFKGGRQIDPDIDLVAKHQTTGLEAQLNLTGPISAPVFTLSSTPALAEDEIMSRILFGRSVSDLTALQIAELGIALNGLRGGSALDVVGSLRRQLGLDVLTIASGEDAGSGALLTGGKYIRDNVYLEVETSTVTSEAAARLRVNITKKLLAESEVGPRLGSSLKIKWFWEY